MTWSVSIVGCSQSVPSTQTPKFEAILDQRVQVRTTYLAANYERLSAKKAKLHQLIMEMRSQMSGICAPFYLPHGPSEDLPPPSPQVTLF